MRDTVQINGITVLPTCPIPCRFFERRPGYALTAALVVATGTSTLFSLFWPFPPDEYKTLNMGKLANAKYGAIFVWLYVLLWFLVQDAAKVLSYALMKNFTVGKEREVDVRLVHGKIRAAIDTENRNERIRGAFVWFVQLLLLVIAACYVVCPASLCLVARVLSPLCVIAVHCVC